MKYKRELLSDFLNLLSIPNDNGLFENSDAIPTPSTADLVAVFHQLKRKYSSKDLLTYVVALHSQDARLWANALQACSTVIPEYSNSHRAESAEDAIVRNNDSHSRINS